MIRVNENGRAPGLTVPDLTALLDVIFILLVFLLLTANIAPKALEVALPQDRIAQAHPLKINNQIGITLFSEPNRWGVQQQEFNNWESFTTALKQQINSVADPKIVLAGDKEVSLQKLLQLFSWLQQHQLNAAQILVRQPEK